MRKTLFTWVVCLFIPLLAECLGRPTPLLAQNGEEALIRLTKAVEQGERAVALSAMKKLGNYGIAGKEAVAPLCDRLRRPDKELASQAGRALAQIGAPAVPYLVKSLEGASPEVQGRVLLTLGTVGREAKEALAPVREFLGHKDARLRFLAALVLGAMHEEARSAAPGLEKALRDPDPRMRFAAADSLFQLGPDMVGRLAAVVRDRQADAQVRLSALAGLGKFLDSQEALTTLQEALHDGEAKIRTAAASSLIRLGPLARPTLPRLVELLKDRDVDVQASAFRAISALGMARDPMLRDRFVRLNDSCRWARERLPRSLGPDKKLAKELERMLFSGDATERLAAALALTKIGPAAGAAVQSLKKCRADRSRTVRAAAVLALARIAHSPATAGQAIGLLEHALEEQRGNSDPADLTRLHIVLSTVPSVFPRQKGSMAQTRALDTAAKVVRKRISEHHFSSEELAALVNAINLVARFDLGFTEPFNTLAFKLQAELQDAKTDLPALFVFRNLGIGVPPDSLHWQALQEHWALAISKLPLEQMIFQTQQKILQDRLEETAVTRFLTDFS